MDGLATYIVSGLLGVGLAWVNNKFIHPSEKELSSNKMIQYFMIGAIAGVVFRLGTGYGILSFFPGGTAEPVTLDFADSGLDSIKIGRPTF